jgi:hypothetical protein
MSYDFDHYNAESVTYPEKPTKPKLTPKHNSAEALAYADALVDYEHEFESYKESLSWYNNLKSERLMLFCNLLRDDYDISQAQFNVIWHVVISNRPSGTPIASQATVDYFDMCYEMASEFAALETACHS